MNQENKVLNIIFSLDAFCFKTVMKLIFKIYFKNLMYFLRWIHRYVETNIHFFCFFLHHTTCESTCDILPSLAANQG